MEMIPPEVLSGLQTLVIADNLLSSVTWARPCAKLRNLSLEDNEDIRVVTTLRHCKQLKDVNLKGTSIRSLNFNLFRPDARVRTDLCYSSLDSGDSDSDISYHPPSTSTFVGGEMVVPCSSLSDEDSEKSDFDVEFVDWNKFGIATCNQNIQY